MGVKTYGKRAQTRLIRGGGPQSRSEQLWQDMLLGSPQANKLKTGQLGRISVPSVKSLGSTLSPVAVRPIHSKRVPRRVFSTRRKQQRPVIISSSASASASTSTTPLRSPASKSLILTTPPAAPIYVLDSTHNTSSEPSLPNTPVRPPRQRSPSRTQTSLGPAACAILVSDSEADFSFDGTNQDSFTQDADRAVDIQTRAGMAGDIERLLDDRLASFLAQSPISSPGVPCRVATPAPGASGLPTPPHPAMILDHHCTPARPFGSRLSLLGTEIVSLVSSGEDDEPKARSVAELPLALEEVDAAAAEPEPELPMDLNQLDEAVAALHLGPLELETAESVLPDLCHFAARRTVRRDHLLLICNQSEPLGFEALLGPTFLTGACKLGESTFSEVFTGAITTSAGMTVPNAVVKIVPFGGGLKVRVNGAKQTTFRDIYQEMCVSWLLGYWPQYRQVHTDRTAVSTGAPDQNGSCTSTIGDSWNFVAVHCMGVCTGAYPAPLLAAWDAWQTENPTECWNARPDFFPEDQLYAVFGLAHAGTPVAKFQFNDVAQMQSLLLQLACSLALAETELEFEHRDLHWDNVLLAPADPTTASKTMTYTVHGANATRPFRCTVPTHGLRVTVIDYTLSRVRTPAGHTLFVNITDEDIFTGQGDRQYDVYREMRQANASNWQAFQPQSNVRWFVYLVDKLLTVKCGEGVEAADLVQPAYLGEPERLCAELGTYASVADLVAGNSLAEFFHLPAYSVEL
ncbi:hypothetical protein IWQ60_007903 [Tieghemiomyces parasiticus]|uniref:non-specific serine/threonine protein kinase n=1 Tax=Tieghemiomyces parasiticus TaxID=78921 RepID=A0A9W8A2U0_9FUNG|nr:hypothetical protein IWQ60_007903 [Tieghemiomyces parasiticus]